jgi:purine-cytosine permease-like protein
MLIAKTHSEKMAMNHRFQRVCYAGTIAGVVLALCTVGRYLFSENLASFLSFLCSIGGGAGES